MADSLSAVEMVNCRLRNSAGMALTTRHASVRLIGCEIADASYGAMLMHGGEVTANHCTFANYYLFTAPRGAIVQFGHYNAESDDSSGMPYLKADISNSIAYGLGTDFSEGDFTAPMCSCARVCSRARALMTTISSVACGTPTRRLPPCAMTIISTIA